MLQLRGAWTCVSHKILLEIAGSHRITFCSVPGGLSYFQDGICLPSLSTVLCVLKSASQAEPFPQRGASRCLWSLMGPDRRDSVAVSSFPAARACRKTKCRTLSLEPTGQQRDLAAPSGSLDHTLCPPVSCQRLCSGKAAQKALGTCCSDPGAGGKCC